MIRYFTTFLLLLSVTVAVKADRVTIVDAIDSAPVPGATVIARSGTIIGTTDADGHITVASSHWPLSVRSLGYEALTDVAPTDTIRLPRATYELPEVVYSPATHPIKRVVSYTREWASAEIGDSTLYYYIEFMSVSYLANGKVKGYDSLDAIGFGNNSKSYALRKVKNRPDSVWRPSKNDKIKIVLQESASLPRKIKEEPEQIRNGATSWSYEDKEYGYTSFTKKNGVFNIVNDPLTKYKNHKLSPNILKLLGATVDILDMNRSLSYRTNGTGHYSIDDLIYGVGDLRIVFKGKVFKWITKIKQNIEARIYLETYPVEITNLTVKEYKEMKKDRSKIPFAYPDYTLPMLPAAKELVERIDRELPEE